MSGKCDITVETPYTDSMGQKRTLGGIIRHEPDWVMARFRAMEAENTSLHACINRLANLWVEARIRHLLAVGKTLDAATIIADREIAEMVAAGKDLT